MPASRRARAPRTPLSTAFRAGGGVVRARLCNLFTTCRRGTALLAAAVLITTLASGLVACREVPGPDAPVPASPSPVITPTPPVTPSPTPEPEHTEPEPEPEPRPPTIRPTACWSLTSWHISTIWPPPRSRPTSRTALRRTAGIPMWIVRF